jgi:DNA topoisomerase-1
MRVGDEKDPEEADTVGASTLRVEHITFQGKTFWREVCRV